MYIHGSVRLLFKLALWCSLVGVCVWLVLSAARLLVVDQPQKADVLLILGGDENDVRFRHAVELLKAGYAPRIIYDAENERRNFGKTDAEYAQEFVTTLPDDVRQHITVCGVAADSTVAEMRTADACLRAAGAHRIVIVTSDFHTRRSLQVARKVLPNYEWAVVAARTPVSDAHWWQSRWALKNVVLEYEKLIWWKVVESHRR